LEIGPHRRPECAVSVRDQTREDDADLTLRQLLSRLWQGRSLIIASIALFSGVFAAAAFLMTPIYQASAVLVPVASDAAGSLGSALTSLNSLTSHLGINAGPMGGTHTEEALAVLRSREFTEGFIADRQLMPELFADQWDAKAMRWKGGAGKQPTPDQAYKRFNEIRTAWEDKTTGLIMLQLEWRDPGEAASWVNGLVARLNAVMRARAIQSAVAYTDYLQKELAATAQIETRQAISRLLEAQINQRMFADVTEDYAFRVVDRALAPDPRDPVRPNKWLLTTLGGITGAFVGGVGVFVLAGLAGASSGRRQSHVDHQWNVGP